jgi:hypothetical protein
MRRISRKRGIGAVALSTAATAALVIAGGLPAMAASAPTPTSFDIGSGALSLSVPAAATLGTGAVAPGTTSVAGPLGPVVVTDNRGLASGTWSATVVSTDFSNGTTTIPAGSITYTAGVAGTTGTITLAAPGTGTLDNTTPLVAQNATALVGTNTATWNPGISVALPLAATTGHYTATITHSVA